MTVPTLETLLQFCRPAGSATERTFCDQFIAPLPDAYRDMYGNWHISRDSGTRTLWSAHTDTVHRAPGLQTVARDHGTGILRLSKRSRLTSSCLGADDTVGVWCLLSLLSLDVPGHYIFHYGEEIGGLGSSALASHHADWLAENFDRAIAIDRKGYNDVITRQSGGRCASDVFALALASALGPTWTPTIGVYTDTAEYIDCIPECTNLSAGYRRAHTPHETCDPAFAADLVARLASIDMAALPTVRDPRAVPLAVASSAYAYTDDWDYTRGLVSDYPDPGLHSATVMTDEDRAVLADLGIDPDDVDLDTLDDYLSGEYAMIQACLRSQR